MLDLTTDFINKYHLIYIAWYEHHISMVILDNGIVDRGKNFDNVIFKLKLHTGITLLWMLHNSFMMSLNWKFKLIPGAYAGFPLCHSYNLVSL